MESKEDLIERIVKEQDLVCYYIIEQFNASLGNMEQYSKDNNVLYSNLKDFILDNKQILPRLKTKNLITILSKTFKEEDKNALVDIISDRLQKEDLFIEDISFNVMMRVKHSSRLSLSSLSQNDIQRQMIRTKRRMSAVKGTSAENIGRHINYLDDASNFLYYYEQGILDERKINLLNRMIEKDKNAIEHVNFGIFQDSIFSMGEEFIEYLSKFPSISEQMVIIAENNPDLMKLLSRHINQYENFQDNFEEIRILTTYFAKHCFDIDISKGVNAEDIIDSAIRESVTFNLRQDYMPVTVPLGEGYKERLDAEYQRRYNEAQEKIIDDMRVKEKLNIYLDRVFSLSLGGAEKLIEEYGSDIDNIEGITDTERELIYRIKDAISLQDEEKIDMLFSASSTVYRAKQILEMREHIAKQCAKSYAKDMKSLDDKIEQSEAQYIEINGHKVKQIKLSGKFEMLLHSTDTGFISELGQLDDDMDFVKNWHNGKNKENHVISTTYTTNDFLSTSPVGNSGVRYGFTKSAEDKIRLMGVTDINTFSCSFAYDAGVKKYMSAKTLPYNSRRVYSEFGIEREGTEPDYVVIFDDDSEEVKENAYKSASQFGIPAVFIDKAQIEEEQMQNLNSMIENFKKDGNVEHLKRLINTYETNRAGWLLNRYEGEEDKTFTSQIDNSRFEQDFNVMSDKIEKVVNEYLEQARENKNPEEARDLAGLMGILIDEIELYKGCDKTKPISKTQISIDAQGLIQNINSTLEVVGGTKYMVDVNNLPTSKEYKLNMEQIVRNALSGENAVNIRDIENAEREMSREIEREDKGIDK